MGADDDAVHSAGELVHVARHDVDALQGETVARVEADVVAVPHANEREIVLRAAVPEEHAWFIVVVMVANVVTVVPAVVSICVVIVEAIVGVMVMGNSVIEESVVAMALTKWAWLHLSQ